MKVTPIFSPEDYDLIDPRWYVSPENDPLKHYAKRTVSNLNPPPRQIAEYAHRIVLERIIGRKLQKGEYCDHINRNKLDNRRENLRVVDAVGNGQNRNCGPSRGITFHKKSGKWQAQVFHKGERAYLGLFENREDALTVAAKRRRELGFLSDAFMTDEQMLNLLKIGLETDLDQTFRYWREIVGDDESIIDSVREPLSDEAQEIENVGEDYWSLRDDGRSDGQGESYAERNL